VGISDEVESYRVGETADVTVNLLVRDRSDPDLASWTVELTTRGHRAPGGTKVDVALELPSASAEELAPLLAQAGPLLAELIEGDANSLPD
jgi:hypothetical protein